MNTKIGALLVTQVIGLAFQLLVGFLIYRYYKTRKFPQSQKYRTFGPRFWTPGIDALVLWPVSFLVAVVSQFTSSRVSLGLLFVQNLATLFYAVVLHAEFGQTVGKMVCKVKVVDVKTEGSITFFQALLREGIPIVINLVFAVCLISAMPTVVSGEPKADLSAVKSVFWITLIPFTWFLVEVITMLTNEKRRALHDFIAGTVAIRTNIDDGPPSSIAYPPKL